MQIKYYNASLEFFAKARLGEGAFWDYQKERLFWIDIEKKYLYIYNPENKTNKSFQLPSKIGTVVPTKSNTAIIALQDGIYTIDLISGSLKLLSSIEKDYTNHRFNDGKCDPSGRLWVGTMSNQMESKKGSLYVVNSSGKANKKIGNLTIPNGIAWSLDSKIMYHIDTPARAISLYKFDNMKGSIIKKQTTINIPKEFGFPDGMTIDSSGMLWVAMWNGYSVICCDPKTGKILSKVEVPAPNVTSCAFGGKNLEILYITSSRYSLDENEKKLNPLSGSLFRVKTGSKGVKNSFFKN